MRRGLSSTSHRRTAVLALELTVHLALIALEPTISPWHAVTTALRATSRPHHTLARLA